MQDPWSPGPLLCGGGALGTPRDSTGERHPAEHHRRPAVPRGSAVGDGVPRRHRPGQPPGVELPAPRGRPRLFRPAMCAQRGSTIDRMVDARSNTSTVPDGSYVVVSGAFDPTGSAFTFGRHRHRGESGGHQHHHRPAVPRGDAVGDGLPRRHAPRSPPASTARLLGVYGSSGPVMRAARLTIVGWFCAWNALGGTQRLTCRSVVSEAFDPAGSAFSFGRHRHRRKSSDHHHQRLPVRWPVCSARLHAPAADLRRPVLGNQSRRRPVERLSGGTRERLEQRRQRLPAPYSGPNVPGAGTDLEMYGPSQVRSRRRPHAHGPARHEPVLGVLPLDQRRRHDRGQVPASRRPAGTCRRGSRCPT